MWRLVAVVVAGLQIVACAKGKAKGEHAVWYVVTSGHDELEKGDMVAVEDSGMRFITSEGRVVLEPVTWDAARNKGKYEHGQVSITKNGSGIVISFNGKEIVRARSASAAEIESANKTLSDRPSDESICGKAARCCNEAMKALGDTCDLDSELGKPPRVHHCEEFLKGMAVTLEAQGKRVSSCE